LRFALGVNFIMRYLTLQGLEKLKNELKERKTKVRREIAERLEEAKALGDLSENTEYSSAREAQAFNEGRILELEEIIRNAVVVSSRKKKKKEIQIGSDISVKCGNQVKHFTIVGSQEAEPEEGKISTESPLGKAFLGHKPGDIVEVKTPRGKMKYKILSIK